jgi:SAM-dependent methyltransferase
MNQQQAWNQEYQNAQGVPTSTRTRPSSAVKRLMSYIADHELDAGKDAIDLGCGIGRNAVYLAEEGYKVTAVDFSERALKKFRHTLAKHPQASHIRTEQTDLAKKLPFTDNSFDLAIDIVTTMTLTPDELPILEAELRRVIRPGGLFLTYVLSNDDGFLETTNPGGTSTTIEGSGITDNYLGEKDLRRLYKGWDIIAMDKIEKVDDFYGKKYTRRIWWMLLRNSK